MVPLRTTSVCYGVITVCYEVVTVPSEKRGTTRLFSCDKTSIRARPQLSIHPPRVSDHHTQQPEATCIAVVVVVRITRKTTHTLEVFLSADFLLTQGRRSTNENGGFGNYPLEIFLPYE